MLARTIRPYSEQEKKQLIARLSSRWSRVESFIGRFSFLIALLLLPALLFDKYFPVSPSSQLIGILLILLLAGGILLYTTKSYEGTISRKNILAAIDKRQVELVHVKTTRAVKRDDPEDFGTAYYLEVQVAGEPRLLYLQGQYFDELDEGVFPNTEFKMVRALDTRELLDLQLLGQPFLPERVLPAFAMADWRRGVTPEDGDVLVGQLHELA